MTYEEFQEYVLAKCLYETIYSDSDGREILIIRMLDAFAMVNDAPKREWVGLTDDEINSIPFPESGTATLLDIVRIIEATLKEKNGG
jgi:hypothetical protein